MNKYNFNNITKIIFLISSILVASLFFYINAIISNESREQHNKQVQTLVNIYHNKINSQNIDFDYLTKVLNNAPISHCPAVPTSW